MAESQTPTPSAPPPAFVPRTVAAFERSALALARRVVAPLRAMAAPALSFADRLLSRFSVAPSEATSGTSRSAGRVQPGALGLATPWYFQDLQDLTAAQARRLGQVGRSTAAGVAPAGRPILPASEMALITAPAEAGGAPATVGSPDVRVRELFQFSTPPARVLNTPAIVQARSVAAERPLFHMAWADDRLRGAEARAESARAPNLDRERMVFITELGEAVAPVGAAVSPSPLAMSEAPNQSPLSEAQNQSPLTLSEAQRSRRAISTAPAVAETGLAAPSTALTATTNTSRVRDALPLISEAQRATPLTESEAPRSLPFASSLPALAVGVELRDRPIAALAARLGGIQDFVRQLVGIQAIVDSTIAPPARSAEMARAAVGSTAARTPVLSYVQLDASAPLGGASTVVQAGASYRGSTVVATPATPNATWAPSSGMAPSDRTVAEQFTEQFAAERTLVSAPPSMAQVSGPASAPPSESAALFAPERAASRRTTLRPGGIAARAEELATLVSLLGDSEAAARAVPRSEFVYTRAPEFVGAGFASPAASPATSGSAPALRSAAVPQAVYVQGASSLRPAEGSGRAGIHSPLMLSDASSAESKHGFRAIGSDQASGRQEITPPMVAQAAARRGEFLAQLLGLQLHQSVAPEAAQKTVDTMARLQWAIPVQFEQVEVEDAAPRTKSGTRKAAPLSPLGGTSTATMVAPSSASPEQAFVSPALHRAAAVELGSALSLFRLGGMAVAAERLGSSVGLRAASLANEFVFPMLEMGMQGQTDRGTHATSGTAFSGPYSAALAPLTPTIFDSPPSSTEGQAADSAQSMAMAEPMRRSALARPQTSNLLSPAEWALVATFPSTATLSQMGAARDAVAWQRAERGQAATPVNAMQQPSASLFTGEMGSGSLVPQFSTSRTYVPEVGWVTSSGETAVGNDTTRRLRGAFNLLSTLTMPIGMAARGELITAASPAQAAAFEASPLSEGEHPAFVPLWNVLPMSAPEMASDGEPESEAGEKVVSKKSPPLTQVTAKSARVQARAAVRRNVTELAPILEMVQAVTSPSTSGAVSQAARFVSEPQPLVQAVPESASSARIVEAARSHQERRSSEDRITLGDLTLIAMAAESQQLAAHDEQQPAFAAGAAAGAPVQANAQAVVAQLSANIEEMAQDVVKEIRRQQEIDRERSGDPWET